MFAVALPITLVVEKGGTLEYVLTPKGGDPPEAFDLTGCEAQIKVKPEWDSATVYEDWSTDNGKLIINGAAGTIAFNVSREDTGAAEWIKGVCALYLDWPDGKTWVLGRGPAFVEIGTR